MAVHIVIPARYESTRLPGKPLADIAGQPMIVRVAAQAAKAQADDIVVAVDDSRVAEAVQAAGWDVQMTRSDHQSGSDRVMEVVQQRVWACDDIVINVQGDEPLVPSEVIDQLIQGMVERPEIPMATLSEPLHQANDFFNPNVVKVVTDDDGLALMFSRAPLPFPRDNPEAVPVAAARHVGIYGFRVQALREFVGLGESRLESIERLEQLRWLQAGRDLLVLAASKAVPGGVDTPEDLARVQALFSA
jgi:3-deoxy-manno-octulosonate cytidylyltransferase (CMP-KDO synthetase)